jgi:hypothetical protein
MLQRALPLQRQHITLREKLGVDAPSKARALVRAFIDHSLRLMRLLGEFAARGGPLS